MGAERLQKLMTHAGIGSRRACEEIIDQGRVFVNGRRAKLGDSADPDQDLVLVDGERLKLPESFDYIMLHKPRGVISDVDVSDRLKTARSLIPLEGHLYPVGRLDVTSEGLLLFTNDGELAHQLTHPSFEHPRRYEVLVEGRPSEQTLASWRAGVYIEGQRTLPAEVEYLRATKEGTLLSVTLREGRKRQIRKVSARLGHPVIRLLRVGMGPLELGDLPAGNWRRLTPLEVAALRQVKRQRRRPRPGTRTAVARPAGSKGPRSAQKGAVVKGPGSAGSHPSGKPGSTGSHPSGKPGSTGSHPPGKPGSTGSRPSGKSGVRGKSTPSGAVSRPQAKSGQGKPGQATRKPGPKRGGSR